MITVETQSNLPLVTIIAVCYNHSKYLTECLEHIRAQTYTNSELIIMDDCSRDDSVKIIKMWIERHAVRCTFIVHVENKGLCKTLNEALSYAKGEYVSLIATDDTWEPDKIERQVAVMREQPESVAVVYSDACKMDESGTCFPCSFLGEVWRGSEPPSGRILAALMDRNFIPAMATLIRRRAVQEVGGYDERMTYEDYDMWLRLAAKYEFIFCPGTVASYRIVSTSMIRTIFRNPTAEHGYTEFLMAEKWWHTNLLSPAQRVLWANKQWEAAYVLYFHGDSRARLCLWKAFVRTQKPRALLLALACSIGISRQTAKHLSSLKFFRSRRPV